MDKEGYLPISRRFFSHPFWREKRMFSKAEAWIDILKNTQFDFAPQQRLINGQIVWQCYGEAIMSTRYCAVSWGWHKTTAERFLKKLESMEQVYRFCGHNVPYIIVINFEKYDPRVDINVDTTGTPLWTRPVHPCGQSKELIIKSSKSIKNDISPNGDMSSCPYLKIIEIYHKKLPSLPKVQSVSNRLKSSLKIRWREDKKRQSLEWWEWYFNGVSECDFLVGKVKDWTADFNWLIGPKNMDKVLNGRYLNRKNIKEIQEMEEFCSEE